jgi:hypothetical protein
MRKKSRSGTLRRSKLEGSSRSNFVPGHDVESARGLYGDYGCARVVLNAVPVMTPGLRIRSSFRVVLLPTTYLSWSREHEHGGYVVHSATLGQAVVLSTLHRQRRYRYLGLRFGRACLPQWSHAIEVERLGQLQCVIR